MQRLFGSICIIIVLVAASATSAGPLATDPNAMPAWRGTMAFSDSVLDVTVDFAVFAPGFYGAGDPSGGQRYVYAYQGFNLSSSRPYSNISVGLQDPAVVFDGGYDPGRPLTGGVIPLFQDSRGGTGFPASSFRSIFQAAGPFTKVGPGQYSQVLLITSPNLPQMFSSSVIDDGQQVQRTLPSPIPEPATLALFALIGAVQLRRRRSAV